MNEHLGDNPIIRINGIGLDRLKYSMKLATGFPAHGYITDAEKGLMVLFKYPSAPNMMPFPAPLDAARSAELMWDWLKAADYPSEPDHDGDNKKGWIIWNDGWDQVDGYGYQSFIAIKPTWIMFGK
jgi:hypothetical protein